MRKQRTGGSPEHNLIQAPEVLTRLTRRLGIRQAHISPTLNEGVQAVVILDDVRTASSDDPITPERYGAVGGTTPDPLNVYSHQLYNPTQGDGAQNDGREMILKVRRIIFDNQKIGASLAYGATYGYRFGWATTAGFVGLISGRSMRNPTNTGAGVGNSRLSHGLIVQNVDTIAANIGPSPAFGRVQCPLDSTVIVDWPDDKQCPVIPPGWGFVVKQSTVNGDVDVTMEWDEEPIRPQR